MPTKFDCEVGGGLASFGMDVGYSNDMITAMTGIYYDMYGDKDEDKSTPHYSDAVPHYTDTDFWKDVNKMSEHFNSKLLVENMANRKLTIKNVDKLNEYHSDYTIDEYPSYYNIQRKSSRGTVMLIANLKRREIRDGVYEIDGGSVKEEIRKEELTDMKRFVERLNTLSHKWTFRFTKP